MTEPSGAARSRSRLVRVLRRLSRRRSSGNFFIFIERRRAGPGDLVREALVGGLAGAAPVGTADPQGQEIWAWDGGDYACSHLAGPRVGGLCSPGEAGLSPSAEPGCGPGSSGAGSLGSSSGMGLYQISPAGSPLPGTPGPRVASSGGLAPPSTQRRLLGSRLCR